MKNNKGIFSVSLYMLLSGVFLLGTLSGCGQAEEEVTTLRVSNWEEYIDFGDWDEDELIELSDGTEIIGENALYDDFEEWYYETYGKKVKVEYSAFGTNEELYNQLTIGDVFDVVCPSEYMIMKMIREDMVEPFDDSFFDDSIEENYYIKGVSPYIRGVYEDLRIDGKALSDYTAGYMWGTLGLVYNPEVVSEEDAKHWDLLLNKDYYRQVTIKDSVRDAYFAAIAMNYYDEITTPEFMNAPDYHDRLSEKLNLTDEVTVENVQSLLTKAKENVYSFETDAGKADMVTGKVVANEQWSGDAVYTMDQASEDGLDLCYSAPEEGTNLWFDGWVMLKCGVEGDKEKQHAAQAFINYVSMPENAIRNMYYIGYTSVISGGDSELIYDYINYNYGAEDEENSVDYDISYFFSDEPESYVLQTDEDMAKRQLYAQYPTKDVVDRSVVMACFDDEDNERINRMWTNVRCFDLMSLFQNSASLKEENGMVNISSDRDIKALSKLVKKGDDFKNKKVVLEADIVLGSGTAIGDEKHPFMGTFDGQGHTVSINGNQGLFDTLGGIVCNVIIDGRIDGDDIAGGVCARLLSEGKIYNCINKAEVYAKENGGIAGSSNGKIINCYNYPAFYDEIEHRSDLDTQAATGITADDENNDGIENCYVGYGELFELKGFGSQEMLEHGFLRAVGNLNKRAAELMAEESNLSLLAWEYTGDNITIGSVQAEGETEAEIKRFVIDTPGEYTVSDKDLGQIVIEPLEGEVKLLLDGVKIENPYGPAILSYGKKADVVIELLPGSENELRGTDFYDIYSKDKKYEGTISVLGNLTIISGKISSEEQEINAGALNIAEAFEGIECNKNVDILGGHIFINSLDDAVAAKKDCSVENAQIVLNAGDDGFDCDSTTIDDGAYVSITAPYEHDFNGGCYLNGGYVAAGSKVGGKCKKESAQGNLMVKTKESEIPDGAKDIIACLVDKDGDILMGYAFDESIDRVSFSCPEISEEMKIEFKDKAEMPEGKWIGDMMVAM